MKRTTIFVPEPLERDLQLYAQRRNKPVAWVVREALASYLAAERSETRVPSFVGVGDSGRTDVADRHEELLWTDPHGDDRPAEKKPRRRPAREARRR
jgi:hypothetical protein